MKNVIIAIVGMSGSGKDTMADHLRNLFGIPAVCSKTTRAIRQGECNGREHWYISKEEMAIEKKSGMIAHTVYGGFDYCVTKSQIDQPVQVFVVNEEGIEYIQKECPDDFVLVPVYVTTTIETRKERGVTDERIERDATRKLLPDSTYVAVIDNNCDPYESVERLKAFYYEHIEALVKEREVIDGQPNAV